LNSKKSRLSRIRNWNRKRKQKSEEKKRIIEAIKARKSLAEKTEETPTKPIAEETKELAPEPITEKTEETPTKPIAEETKELAPEPITEKTEETPPKLPRFGIRSLFKKRMKKKKEKESGREPEWMKILTFAITLVAMLLGLSIMPLFPQPLPAVLAFLIAFVAFKRPILGMPVGGLLIGLGLMYNLAKLNFIAMLGETEIRWFVVFIFLFLFTALPIIFRDRKSAIVINLGIIAAISLFFNQAYFLAIPLIFSSIVIFKKISILSVIYYVLLSVPLQIMQYLNHVTQIMRVDWWVEPGSSPPIYVPLTEIFTNVQDSMLQFRLYDTSKVVFAISEQMTLEPPLMEHSVMEMLSHYLDSLPGIILFLFMIIGIVAAIVLLVRTTFSQTNLGDAEKILPIITATTATILFFVLANSLQDPLAFRVDLNGATMALGTFATLIFTIPTFFMDQAPKERATIDMIKKKSHTLLEKLLSFEEVLNTAKTLPISFSALETKSIISKDKLEDINIKNSKNLLAPSEIDEVLKELNKLEKTIDSLDAELDVLLSEYQIFSNCENSKWIGQFETIGIKVKNKTITKFERGLPLKKRIESINEIIKRSRVITEEIIDVSEQIYGGIRALFDPNLPKESQSIIFSRKRMNERVAPWNILETLYVSLINMKKNYKNQISDSIENLESSLNTINNFSNNNEKLSKALGEDYIKLIGNAKKVEDIQINLDKENFSIIDVIAIKNIFDNSVGITKRIFTILFENFKTKEKAIESLMPPEGYMWGRNLEIKEKMASAIKMFKRTTNLKSAKVLEKLPSFLTLAEKGMKTIIAYNEKEELLLNYPIAEIVVEEQLKKNKQVTAKDLPFDPKYGKEYLKLFHSKRYHESSYDKANNILRIKE
jgi:hypothetical protein